MYGSPDSWTTRIPTICLPSVWPFARALAHHQEREVGQGRRQPDQDADRRVDREHHRAGRDADDQAVEQRRADAVPPAGQRLPAPGARRVLRLRIRRGGGDSPAAAAGAPGPAAERPAAGSGRLRRGRRLRRRRRLPRRGRRPGRLGRLPFAWGFLAFAHARPFTARRPPYLHYSPPPTERSPLSEVKSGLEGVVAFETEIAEPDKEGGALRYRGVDIEDLVGRVPFEKVWGLLVDGQLRAGPAARRAAPAHRPLRRLARRPAGGARDARARVGDAAAARHPRRAGARGPRPRVGDGALLRRPVGARGRRAAGAAGARSTRRARSPSAS